MDDARFDALTRQLASRRSRRRILPALVGGLVSLGGVLSAPLAGAGAPDPRPTACGNVGRKCGVRHPCCPGLGLVCRRHKCRRQTCRLGANGMPCGDGQLCCGGVCEDVRANPLNCGACDRACLTGERCLGGLCVSPCRAGLTACNGQCVDVLTDAANCGSCGIACRGAASDCVDGQCRCPGGLTLCDSVCVDTQTEPAHCGACARPCPSGNVCQAGACVSRCKDDGQACSANTDCCRFPESTCNDGVCARRCSAYGGPCASEADCCESGPGIRPPCIRGICTPCDPFGDTGCR